MHPMKLGLFWSATLQIIGSSWKTIFQNFYDYLRNLFGRLKQVA